MLAVPVIGSYLCHFTAIRMPIVFFSSCENKWLLKQNLMIHVKILRRDASVSGVLMKVKKRALLKLHLVNSSRTCYCVRCFDQAFVLWRLLETLKRCPYSNPFRAVNPPNCV